jgi:hypothetical protein
MFGYGSKVENMRFEDLSQEATQHLWEKWKYAIREILDEFNEDVFHCGGKLRENAHDERPYLLLETKGEFLYIFPLPDNLLSLGVYRHKIPKERLASKFAADKPDDENLIGWVGLDAGALEGRYGEDKESLQYYLEKALRRLQRSYWTKTI